MVKEMADAAEDASRQLGRTDRASHSGVGQDCIESSHMAFCDMLGSVETTTKLWEARRETSDTLRRGPDTHRWTDTENKWNWVTRWENWKTEFDTSEGVIDLGVDGKAVIWSLAKRERLHDAWVM